MAGIGKWQKSDRFATFLLFRLTGGVGKWYNIHWIRRIATKMCMLDEIRAKREEIYAIARKHKAEKLWVFGSCARKEETPESDVDFLVEFGEGASLFTVSRLKHSLADYLSRDVDIVSRRCIDDNSVFSRQARKYMVAL